MEEKQQIDEIHVNLAGRVFFSAVASWLLGRGGLPKFHGNSEQMIVLTHALKAVKDFHDTLKQPDADISTVMKLMSKKNSAIKQFEQAFGIKWPKQL